MFIIFFLISSLQFLLLSYTVKPVITDDTILGDHFKISQLFINYLEYTSFERPPVLKDHIWVPKRCSLKTSLQVQV